MMTSIGSSSNPPPTYAFHPSAVPVATTSHSTHRTSPGAGLVISCCCGCTIWDLDSFLESDSRIRSHVRRVCQAGVHRNRECSTRTFRDPQRVVENPNGYNG